MISTLAEPFEQSVAAGGAIGVEIDIGGHNGLVAMLRHSRGHCRRIGMIDIVMPHLGDRRGIAAADTGCAHHADLRTQLVAEGVEQRFRSGHRAGQTIADANGHRRRGGLAVMHHVEMRIECSDLVDLGLGHVQLLGERREVAH